MPCILFFKFYDLAKIYQITKLNTLSKFPTIQYGTNTELLYYSYTLDYGFTAFFQLKDGWLTAEKLPEVNLCQIICEINRLNKHLEPFNAFPLNNCWLNIVPCTHFVNVICKIDTLKLF